MKFSILALATVVATIYCPISDAAFVPSASWVGKSRIKSLEGRLASTLSLSSVAPITASPTLGEIPTLPELGADGIYHIQTAAQHK
jgi:hypothetical protein